MRSAFASQALTRHVSRHLKYLPTSMHVHSHKDISNQFLPSKSLSVQTHCLRSWYRSERHRGEHGKCFHHTSSFSTAHNDKCVIFVQHVADFPVHFKEQGNRQKRYIRQWTRRLRIPQTSANHTYCKLRRTPQEFPSSVYSASFALIRKRTGGGSRLL